MPEDDTEEQQNSLWHQAIKDVRPLSSTQRHRTHIPQSPRRYYQVAPPTPLPHKSIFSPCNPMEKTARPKQSISRKQGRRIQIEATLDLHGHTHTQAQYILQVFCHTARHQGKTWVLVITGKGALHNEKTLRKLMPQWLKQLPDVVAYAHARPCHGGQGAFYVQLASRKRTRLS